jgi:transposase-like protein
MRYPYNQLDFERMFSSEDKCQSYLFECRYPNGFTCSKCSNTEFWKNSRDIYVCKFCKHEHSITANTIFHQSKLPLMIHFRAIWWMMAPRTGVSAKGLQKILGIGSYQTAWAWLHKYRKLMIIPDRNKLSDIVEVDETYVGGEKSGKRGRGAEGKVIVAIAVETRDRATGRVRLSVVEDVSSQSLMQFVKDNVYSGSTVITDNWNSYNNLPKAGYKHSIQTATKKLDDIELLPNAHRVASLLKRWLLGTHQNFVSNEKLTHYLDEFVFRYNRRTSKHRGLLFYRIIEQSVIHCPVRNEDV